MGGAPITEQQVAESPHVMIGSADSLAEKFGMLRERLGITSFAGRRRWTDGRGGRSDLAGT